MIKEHIPTHLTVSPLPCRQIFLGQDVGLRSCVRLNPIRATPPVDNVFFSVLSSRAVITLSFNWQESQTAISLPRCQLTPHWYVKFCPSLTVQSTIKSNPELIIRFVWSNLCKQVSFTVSILHHREVMTQPMCVQTTTGVSSSLALFSTMACWLSKRWDLLSSDWWRGGAEWGYIY